MQGRGLAWPGAWGAEKDSRNWRAGVELEQIRDEER